MKIGQVLKEASVIAAAFVGLQILQAGLLKDALWQLDRMAIRRLQAGVVGILNKAHSANDDISIVQVLEALNKAPGVVHAQILDPKNQDRPAFKSYSYPLEDKSKKWGCLVLTLSDRLLRKLVRRQWVIGTASAAVTWSLIFLYLQYLARRRSILERQAQELRGMLQTAERQFNALVEREHLGAQKAMTCLQEAVEHIPDPTAVLDSQQKVAAINAAALRRLGLSRTEEALFKSWHEIPHLQACGMQLEQSLQSPMAAQQTQSSPDGLVLSLTTLKGHSGTWVTFIASKRVVE